MSSIRCNEAVSIPSMGDVSHHEFHSFTISHDRSLCNPGGVLYPGAPTSVGSAGTNNVNSHPIAKDDTRRVLLGSRVLGFQDSSRASCFGVILDTNRKEGDVNVNTNRRVYEGRWSGDKGSSGVCERTPSTASLSWRIVVMLTDHIYLHDVLCSPSGSSLLFHPHSIPSAPSAEESLLSSSSSSYAVAPWEQVMSAVLLQTELLWDGASRRILSWGSQRRVENTLTAVRTWTQLLLDGFLRWVPPSTGVRLLFARETNKRYPGTNNNNNNNNNRSSDIVDRCGEIRVALLGVEDVRLVQQHWANLRRYWSPVGGTSCAPRENSVSTCWGRGGELHRTIAAFHKHCRPVLQQFADFDSNNSDGGSNEEVGCVKRHTKKWSIKNSMRLTYAMAIVAHIEVYLQASSSSSSSLFPHDISNTDTSTAIPFSTAQLEHFIEILAFLLVPRGLTVCDEGRRVAREWINTHLCTQEAHRMLFSGPSRLLFHDFLASFAHWLLLQVVPNLLRGVNVVLFRRMCDYASSCSGCKDENYYSEVHSPSRALRLRFQCERGVENKSAVASHITTSRRNLLGDISLTDWMGWLQKQEREPQSVSKRERNSRDGNKNGTDEEIAQGHAFFFCLPPAGTKLLSILDSLELFYTATITTTAVLSDRTFDTQQTALPVGRWTIGCTEEEVFALQQSLNHPLVNMVKLYRRPLRLFTLAEFISHYRTIVDAPRIERIVFSSFRKVKPAVVDAFCPLPPLLDISLTHFNHFSPVNQAKLICSAVGLNYTAYVSSKEEKKHQQREQERLLHCQEEEEEERMEWQKQQQEERHPAMNCDEVGMYGSEVMMIRKVMGRSNRSSHHSSCTAAVDEEGIAPILSLSSSFTNSTSITVVEDSGVLKLYNCAAAEELESARHSASLRLHTCGIILLQIFLRSRWSWRWNMLPLRRRAHRMAVLTVQRFVCVRRSALVRRRQEEKQEQRMRAWCEERRRQELMHENLIRRMGEGALTYSTTAMDDDGDDNNNTVDETDPNKNTHRNHNRGEKDNPREEYDINVRSYSRMAAVGPMMGSTNMHNVAVAIPREVFSPTPSAECSTTRRILQEDANGHPIEGVNVMWCNNSLAETFFAVELKGRCLVESMEAKKRRLIFISLEERVRERYLLQEYHERRVVGQRAVKEEQQATAKARRHQWHKRQVQQKQRLLLLQKEQKRQQQEQEQEQREQQQKLHVVMGKRVAKRQTDSVGFSTAVTECVGVPRGAATPKDKQEKGDSNDIVIVIDVNEDLNDVEDKKQSLPPPQNRSVMGRHSPALGQNQEHMHAKRGSVFFPRGAMAIAKTVGVLGEKGRSGIRTRSSSPMPSCSPSQMAFCRREYEDRTFIELSQRYHRQLLWCSATLSRFSVTEMQHRRLLFITFLLERQELLTRWKNIILPYMLITETLYGDFLAVMVLLQDAPRRRGPAGMRSMLRWRHSPENVTGGMTAWGCYDNSREGSQEGRREERQLDKENSLIGGRTKEGGGVMRGGGFLQKRSPHLPTGRSIPQQGKITTTRTASSLAPATASAAKEMATSRKGETSGASSRRPVVTWADPPIASVIYIKEK